MAWAILHPAFLADFFQTTTTARPELNLGRSYPLALRRLLGLPVILIVFVATYDPCAQAAIPFQPISPEELKMTSEPMAPGAPAVILFRQVDRDDNLRTGHEDNYFRIKILTEEGRKYADVEIEYFKESENINGIRARTIRTDGSVAEFD